MDWLDEQHYSVGWTHDHGAAYLFCRYREHINIVARWFRGRPELSTLNPGLWRLGLAVAAEGGTLYDATPMRDI